MKLFANWLRRPSSADLIARFLLQPEHGWILRERPLRDSLVGFFQAFSAEELQEIFFARRLLLLYSNQRMSCALYQYPAREIVLVFPELRRLLLSAQHQQAYAILAHELGHVWNRHSRKKIEMLAAQLEADRFASEHGFGEDLALLLEAEETSPETIARCRELRRS